MEKIQKFKMNKFIIKIILIVVIIFGTFQMTGCAGDSTDREEQQILDCVKRALSQGTDTNLCYPENNPLGIVWMDNFHIQNPIIFIIKPST